MVTTHVGARVRALRESRGMSVSELARRARVARENLYRLESGATRLPRIDHLRRIAGVLEASLDDIAPPWVPPPLPPIEPEDTDQA